MLIFFSNFEFRVGECRVKESWDKIYCINHEISSLINDFDPENLDGNIPQEIPNRESSTEC